ncbi:MAG TPA: non-homologous end-joining DNA ligase [Euzebyales bacterium]
MCAIEISIRVPPVVAGIFALPWEGVPSIERHRDAWSVELDGHTVRLTNLDKIFWPREGYTKGDVVAYYLTVADDVLPYVRQRPLTMKRMPDGAFGDFFYAKQAPSHTPGWITTAPVEAIRSGARIDYVVPTDRASLAWLANLGCIELHPWHSRVESLGAPDYAFFDLDPFGVDFVAVRDVALHVRAVLDQLGLRSYPRTSGATGMQVYVPIDAVHAYGDVRAFVERCCALINQADPRRTTMAWDIGRRDGKVFLDHNMNTEGRNIAATWSLRPEPAAPVATPLTWDEVAGDVVPTDFTIATFGPELVARSALFAPVLAGGQRLAPAMAALGLPEPGPVEPHHRIASSADDGDRPVTEEPGDLDRYVAIRDFARTPEPSGGDPTGDGTAAGDPAGGEDAARDDTGGQDAPRDDTAGGAEDAPRDDTAAGGQDAPRDDTAGGADPGPRFVIQHHLASRLHHDLRLERGGTLRSWALPKGLPLVRGERHLAVQTEDHPLRYLDFSGEIPAGEYGAGSMRIWDTGDYDVREWTNDKVTFRLHGRRHRGAWHLFRPRSGDASQWLVTRVDDGVDVPAPPRTYAPMLAATRDEPFDDEAWGFEIKWDGVRAIATVTRPGLGRPFGTRLRTRRGNEVAVTYPELAGVWERVLAWTAVLDGEIVAFDREGRPSFERLQRRMNVRDEHMARRMADEIPVSYMAFDLLEVDGEDLTGLGTAQRLARLDDVLVPGGPVRRSEVLGSSGTAVFEAARHARLEGVLGKRADAPYRPGQRSTDWVKIKVRHHVDAVIGGWLPKSDTPGGSEPYSLLVGLWDGPTFRWIARVGSGVTGAERTTLAERLSVLATEERPFADDADLPADAHWVRPELVCRVEYGEVTEGLRLRAPTYQGRRTDVDPRTCLLTDLPNRPS